ncbi:MAG: hypothetical protein LUG93_14775 [Lachnospiraceae bacterium]|nr:hypothetical protein [Lachnospiraceae bacterium]
MASGFREEKSTAGTGSGSRKLRRRSRTVRGSSAGRGRASSLRMRGLRLKPRMPSWMHWYDLVMVPLLILAAVMVVRNIQDVLRLFLWLTVWLLGTAFVVGLIAITILAILFLILRGRRRRRRW